MLAVCLILILLGIVYAFVVAIANGMSDAPTAKDVPYWPALIIWGMAALCWYFA